VRPTSLSTLLALFGLALFLHASPARAGEDGGVLDAPDASVGQGGADQGQEEDDGTGTVALFCQKPSDCSKGFGCQGRRCVWVGYRNAEEGCLLGLDATAAALLGLVLVGTRGLRRRDK
jgi:hypothetical protein